MIPKTCDVAIIGGGPAGSSAAAMLARQGRDVVLLEKARHPRNMVGESVIPHFWKYADRIGISDAIEEEGFIKKSGGTVAWDGCLRQMTFGDFGFDRPGLHVERDRFDKILLEHARGAGARIFEEVAVNSVARLDDQGGELRYHSLSEEVSGSLSARYIIDASGRASCIARAKNMRRPDDDFRFLSVWGYFQGGKYVADGGEVHPMESLRQVRPTTFVSSIGPTGWSWHIPMRSSTSVGLVLPMSSVKKSELSGSHKERFFLEHCHSLPYLKDLLEEADYIPGSVRALYDYSFRVSSHAGPGYFVVGDAGGFIDPIFSLGVVLAVFSGTAAAWMVGRCFRRPDRAAAYQTFFSELVSQRRNLSRAMALPLPLETGQDEAGLRELMELHTTTERDLFQVVSHLTNRSFNFERITGLPPASESLRCTVLKGLRY